MSSPMTRIHATCVDLGGAGVLLRGASGAGKSDLALRLIDGGGRLVSDDQTELTVVDGRVVARAPEPLAGLIEVRGLGVVAIDHVSQTVVRLVVDLMPPERIERMPQPAVAEIEGVALPLARIAPFEPSAAAKLRLALRSATNDIMPPL